MLNITLPAVPAAFPNPRFDDAIVQRIQQKMATLSWMDRAYHIARVGVIAKNELSYPQIQANNTTSEVYNIRPDNNIGAYCFFEVTKPYILDTYSQVANYFISVTVWANMNNILPATTTDITGDLIRDVIQKLIRCEAGDFEVEERPEEIFKEYSGLTQKEDQHLLRRYTAFKISFKVVTEATNSC